MRMRCLATAVLFVTCACTGRQPAQPAEQTASKKTEAAPSSIRAEPRPVERREEAGASSDASASALTPGLPTTCTAECKTHSLSFHTKARKFAFSSAAYGVHEREKRLYIVAWEGKGSGCEHARDPGMKRSFETYIPVPVDNATIHQSDGIDGVRATVVDYVNEMTNIRPAIFHSIELELRPSAALICMPLGPYACVSPSAGFIALDVDVDFGVGSVKGRLYAEYCADLDE